MKKMNLPFTSDLKGGNKKSFKILNDKEMEKDIGKNESIINFLKKIIVANKNNNENKVNYVKASTTKKYYKNLSHKLK